MRRKKNDVMKNMAEWMNQQNTKNNKQTNNTTMYEEMEKKTVLVRLIDSLETENTG